MMLREGRSYLYLLGAFSASIVWYLTFSYAMGALASGVTIPLVMLGLFLAINLGLMPGAVIFGWQAANGDSKGTLKFFVGSAVATAALFVLSMALVALFVLAVFFAGCPAC